MCHGSLCTEMFSREKAETASLSCKLRCELHKSSRLKTLTIIFCIVARSPIAAEEFSLFNKKMKRSREKSFVDIRTLGNC